MTVKSISPKDSDEIRTMHTISHNIEIMMGNETEEIIEELFKSLLQTYQEGLETSMRGSKFVFDSVDLLYRKLPKTNQNRGGSYIDSPEWIKTKKATINLKNNDNKGFQFVLAVALNYQNIENNLERLSKIKPFIDQYNWSVKEIDFPSHEQNRKKFELSNKAMVLNMLYVPHNTEEVRHAYK